jgi:hypothetical protein
MFEQFAFTVGYTFILLCVSFLYYKIGYSRGVQDALLSVRHFEPVALDKALDKMKEQLNEAE